MDNGIYKPMLQALRDRTMETPNGTPKAQTQDIKPGSQLCSINIMFAATSDDEALEVKKKVGEAVSGLDNVRVQFSMTTMPKRPIPEA